MIDKEQMEGNMSAFDGDIHSHFREREILADVAIKEEILGNISYLNVLAKNKICSILVL